MTARTTRASSFASSRSALRLGILATDYITDGRTVVEDTIDWYAQDKQGNI